MDQRQKLKTVEMPPKTLKTGSLSFIIAETT
jgi:hypothetical protein